MTFLNVTEALNSDSFSRDSVTDSFSGDSVKDSFSSGNNSDSLSCCNISDIFIGDYMSDNLSDTGGNMTLEDCGVQPDFNRVKVARISTGLLGSHYVFRSELPLSNYGLTICSMYCEKYTILGHSSV